VMELPFTPVFCDILVGDDHVSLQYVRMKEKTAMSVGIKFKEAFFKENTTTEELLNEIENLNKVPHMCGIIVQLPLPTHIDKQRVLDAIDSNLDVDCLGTVASEKFYNHDSVLGFPTALACMKALDFAVENLENKKIIVLGRGSLVGRPVTHLLQMRGLSVDVVTRQTENKNTLLKEADIVISAMGQGKDITGDMIKEGVVIIDAGTSEENNAVVGDVDFESIQNIASWISPVPGGVGPVTIAILLKNVLSVAQKKACIY
jgi:methylenetetrahydrofolate dehydrogenase (NADP+)/methenyltetrahydrofolate cyclohydrolase